MARRAELMKHFQAAHQMGWRVAADDFPVTVDRCLIHRAVMNYEMTQHRRVLLRCVVRGTAPV